MIKDIFRYDPELHKYFLNDKELPHITGLIPQTERHCTIEQWEDARERGKENHEALKMFFDTGCTFDNPLIERIKKWIWENKSTLGRLIEYERPRYSKKYLFAGTPDMIFEKAIVELKPSMRDCSLQMGGQHILAVENQVIRKTNRWIVLWPGEKEMKCKNIYNMQAENVFKAIVQRYYLDEQINNYFKR